MNGRRVFREYAQYKGKEAKEFVGIESEMYCLDVLRTKANNGIMERTSLDYKQMVHLLIAGRIKG